MRSSSSAPRNVGRAVVEALHSSREMTVIDVDDARLTPLADRYDVRTVEGNGTTKRGVLAEIQHADLLIACSRARRRTWSARCSGASSPTRA